jgi:hypothetical protein
MPHAQRYVGLDVHKYYLIATAVDADLNKVYGPRRVELADLEGWIKTMNSRHMPSRSL